MRQQIALSSGRKETIAGVCSGFSIGHTVDIYIFSALPHGETKAFYDSLPAQAIWEGIPD